MFKSVTILWNTRRRHLLGGLYRGLLLIIIVRTYFKIKELGFQGSTKSNGPRPQQHRGLLDHIRSHHSR